MELSSDADYSGGRLQKISNWDVPSPDHKRLNYCDNDIIDVDAIHFEDDRTWLYAPPKNCGAGEVINSWFYKDLEDIYLSTNICNSPGVCNPSSSRCQSPKNIDTRTFTRPKKRFNRPSIEKYNDEVYGDNVAKDITEKILEENEDQAKPVRFDLSQPANTRYFQNILANNTADIDSFQNMSPPSLVNSMCSSMFANLMESSFIKNDPVLREIRDADLTESVLLQDLEPPTLQSITDSWSSFNSDTPENFLKKVSFNGTLVKNTHNDETIEVQNNVTFNIENEKMPEILENKDQPEDLICHETELNSFYGTYQKTSKIGNSFRKSGLRSNTIVIESPTINPEVLQVPLETTVQTLIKDCTIKSFEGTKTYLNINGLSREDTIENMKSELSEAPVADINGISYCVDDDDIRLDSGYTDSANGKNADLKRQSIGSADSLDRMSSISTSSRESGKMLSVADVDAIAEMQERCLEHVMSTPKVNSIPSSVYPRKFFDKFFISPIGGSAPAVNSTAATAAFDSDGGSSNDEYRSVHSSASASETSLDEPTVTTMTTTAALPAVKCFATIVDTNVRTKSAYTVTQHKPLQACTLTKPSYTSSKPTVTVNTATTTITTHSSSYNRPRTSANVCPTSTVSNLKSMGARLKGSYTSLRPISANLPVAPPIILPPNPVDNNLTHVVPSTEKIGEVPAVAKDKPVIGDHTFIKPMIPRASGLPRPTGIPRPASSRIPGPRTTNIRSSLTKIRTFRRTEDYQ